MNLLCSTQSLYIGSEIESAMSSVLATYSPCTITDAVMISDLSCETGQPLICVVLNNKRPKDIHVVVEKTSHIKKQGEYFSNAQIKGSTLRIFHLFLRHVKTREIAVQYIKMGLDFTHVYKITSGQLLFVSRDVSLSSLCVVKELNFMKH